MIEVLQKYYPSKETQEDAYEGTLSPRMSSISSCEEVSSEVKVTEKDQGDL